MNTQNVSSFIKTIQKGIVKHSPEILTALGIGGMITTTVMAVKATPKALKRIEERKEEEQKDDLTVVETVKTAYKPYIPAAITGVASVACLIGAQSINIRRNAALVAAYQISTTALSEYKEAATKVVGEDKAKEIRDKIVEEKKERATNGNVTYIISNEDEVLIFEPFSNVEFKSTTNKVEKAMIEMNKRMTNGREHCISLNEFLNEMNLKSIPRGDDIGWSADKLIDLTFDPSTNDSGTKPRFDIAYLTPPEYGYNEYY